jgi:polyphenol oxidase
MTLALSLSAFDAPHIRHGFYGRKGGISAGPFASLNCGRGTNDPHVLENRAIVALDMGGAAEDIVTIYQIHSHDCIYVGDRIALDKRPQADGMVTDVPGLILGIITADCAPVLFHGVKEKGTPIIGAAHAGWKGALGGVLEDTVRVMIEQGAIPQSIVAAVGPTIVQKSYEVSSDFEKPFLQHDPRDGHFFKPGPREGKLFFDLPAYVAKRLADAGVLHVILSDVDTLTNHQDYFSHRRSTLAGDSDQGRQISCIKIEKT